MIRAILTWVGLLACAPLVQAQPVICQDARLGLAALAKDAAARQAVEAAFAAQQDKLGSQAWLPGYCRAVADNVDMKRRSIAEGVTFDTAILVATTVEYEAFRIATFRTSGVAPKLYVGFLDRRGRTAAYEAKLFDISTRAADLLNAHARKRGLTFTVTAKEIAVTQISEGGALLLTADFANVDQSHPVYGVGLDDYMIGFKRYPGLLAEVDAAFGTKLSALKGTRADALTFTETILGTAIMYLYEKDLADQKLKAEKRAPIASLPLDEQFVHASLVYNSGILFSDERVKQMLAFDAGAYLFDISERSYPKRPKLVVMPPDKADAWLAEGRSLPEQPTSWNAVYHVLQRYGGWVALTSLY